MPETRVPIDPANPGHFFACCGLFELLETIAPGGTAHFASDGQRPRRAEFVVQSAASLSTNDLLAELRKCQFKACDHPVPKIAPATVRWFDHDITLNWWLDDRNVDKHVLKPWGGPQSGVGVLQALAAALPRQTPSSALFNLSAYITTRLGVDPRSTWNRLDCGYSPNNRNVEEALSAPVVDLLAGFGLQGFRPRQDNGSFVYALWWAPLPRAVARAAAAGALQVVPQTQYQFRLLHRSRGSKAFDFAEERQGNSR